MSYFNKHRKAMRVQRRKSRNKDNKKQILNK